MDSIKPGVKRAALGFVKQIREMRRKRVMANDHPNLSPIKTPLKSKNHRISTLESLPQEILIRILCCVDHDDLKQLCQVSESIRDATSIAKRDHFAFSTPSKRVPGLRSCSGAEFEDDEAPNAPKQQRNGYRARIGGKKLADISVALFRSPEKQPWKRNLVFGIEAEAVWTHIPAVATNHIEEQNGNEDEGMQYINMETDTTNGVEENNTNSEDNTNGSSSFDVDVDLMPQSPQRLAPSTSLQLLGNQIMGLTNAHMHTAYSGVHGNSLPQFYHLGQVMDLTHLQFSKKPDIPRSLEEPVDPSWLHDNNDRASINNQQHSTVSD